MMPSHCAANAIEVASIPNALSIPLEAVITDSGYSYVYKKDGRSIVKQMVETGAMNEIEITVRKGLTPDDHIYLAPPTHKAAIQTVAIAGLEPAGPAVPTGDTANGVTLPARSNGVPAVPGGSPKPVAIPKR